MSRIVDALIELLLCAAVLAMVALATCFCSYLIMHAADFLGESVSQEARCRQVCEKTYILECSPTRTVCAPKEEAKKEEAK